MARRKILVTSALPYVNAGLHLGHMVEHIQTDTWVRFQRLRGHEVRFFCGDDTHGTATMLRAQREGRAPEALLEEMRTEHVEDLAAFGVEHDHYGSTHSPANEELVRELWAALRAGGHVEEREVTQLFDPEAGIFLADRFVTGRCPRPDCGAEEQYGDNCEVCGATYEPSDLIDPRSTITGAVPEERSHGHLFVRLEAFHDFLETWTQSEGHVPPETANWLKGAFLSEPLRDWDVSRPAPYFGFEIPDAPGNYFYVWVDAPVGYIAATREWCDANGESLADWWQNEQVEIHHFIGKDIAYFHTLFWPAMLKTAGYALPRAVHVHGFLTVNNEKMSKRKGTFIQARTYLEHLSPEYLRYYFASKLSSRVDDIDLSLDEFVQKVNADLVGKVVNLASRTARFVKGEVLPAYPAARDEGLFAAAAAAGEEIAAAYEQLDTGKAMRSIMALADRANEFVESRAPWALKKEASKREELIEVCAIALNLFRQITIYLAPVVPRLAEASSRLLGVEAEVCWSDASTPVAGTAVGRFEHLMQRVDPEHVEAMVEASREAAGAAVAPPVPSGAAESEALAGEPLEAQITIDDFVKVDLRVAEIVAAQHVPKANKLLELTLSLGGEERRTVFAGIKKAYDPEALVGRLTVVVANLAPREMKFGTSQGMVLAAGPGDQEIFLLSPDVGARPGQRIR